jgi:hypothetical protein
LEGMMMMMKKENKKKKKQKKEEEEETKKKKMIMIFNNGVKVSFCVKFSPIHRHTDKKKFTIFIHMTCC